VEIRRLARGLIFPGLDGEGSLRDFIVSAKQVFAQTIVRAMSEPPDVAQLLTSLTAAGTSGRGLGERKSARVLLDGSVQVFFQLSNFAELFRGCREGRIA